jgi:TIR domain
MTDGDPFEYDLFISYAHRDNQPVPGNETGWVQTLYACVKHQLGVRLGRDPSLWMDSADLRHGHAVSEQLVHKVKKSAALLIVLSRSYLNSEWCRKERNEFLKLTRERGGIESIYIVEVDQIDRAEIPSELSDLRTFRFWKPLEGGAVKMLGFPRPDKDDDYFNRVVELCTQIARLLQKPPPPPESIDCAGLTDHTSLPWPEPPLVFLAQVTDDLDMEAAFVRSFLEQQGISVLPPAGVFYPPTLADFQKEAEKDISASEYFVQLLSDVVGRRPPDVPQGFPAFQYELAERLDKKIVQWRNPSVQVEDVGNERHRALLERATVQTGSLEVFKQEIIRKIREDKKPSPILVVPRDHRQIFLFVNMDDTDRALANEVCSILKNEGVYFSIPLRSEKPEEIRIDLEENLRLCDGLIVVYGNTTQAWVRRQVLQAQKALALREMPAMMRGICLAPPEHNKDLEDPVGMNLDAVLDCIQGVKKEEIHKFIEHVRRSVVPLSPVAS